MLVKRDIQGAVQQALFQGKIIVIYGSRRVGKTTLVKELLAETGEDSAYFNCDEPDIREALTDKTSTELRSFIGHHRLVVFDEAQRVRNIGLTLKLIADTFPEIQVIATGSSSFDLSGKIAESLTGRKIEFFLAPFSVGELLRVSSALETDRLVEERLVFGLYPDIVLNPGEREPRLRELASSYAYKDVLMYQNLRSPELLERILKALALQVGSEVSYTELAQTVDANKITVESYIRILEQAYIVFRLGPFSRNLRNEIKRKRKIYFHDLGIRNALINNFNPVSLRQDVGALWENFLVSERLKRNNNQGRFPNRYFWRTKSGKEIDYLEESGGTITGYEFKWRKATFSVPKEFLRGYPESTVTLVNRENYREFLVA